MKTMQYCILLLLSIICWADCIPSTKEWNEFKRKFNKQYESKTEEVRRIKIFLENVKQIVEHNIRFVNGKHSYSLGINKYCDLTDEEFRSMNGFRVNPNVFRGNISKPSFPTDVPDSIDWRAKGAVTEVKDQKRCGSCWAFSITGTLEGFHFIKTGKLVSLSEQQLVDCDKKNNGCNGGDPAKALEYIKRNGGINSDRSYPYEGREGACRFKRHEVAATCNGAMLLPSGDEKSLKQAVASLGPIAVAIQSDNYDFRKYEDGVFDDPKCGRNLDHAVLVVGYGTTTDGKDYWIVKNSWGSSWGDKGYIKMVRNKNICGIADYANYPNLN